MLPAAGLSLESEIGTTKSPWGIPRAARVLKVHKVHHEDADREQAVLKPKVESTSRTCRTCARERPIEDLGRNGTRWRR
jgi:hypothetical protein